MVRIKPSSLFAIGFVFGIPAFLVVGNIVLWALPRMTAAADWLL